MTVQKFGKLKTIRELKKGQKFYLIKKNKLSGKNEYIYLRYEKGDFYIKNAKEENNYTEDMIITFLTVFRNYTLHLSERPHQEKM